jgi:hypothetical protein
MAYTSLYSTFESDYQQPLSPVKATGSSSSGGSSGKGAAGIVASGVISGLTDIATGFINAGRVKNTFKFNQAMAQLQGRMTRLAADVEIKNIRKKAQSLFSSQRAAYAKAGVKMEGSPAVVMANSLKEAELDAIYADISATYNVGLTETQAGIYQMQGQSAQIDAWTNAFKGILNMTTQGYARG